MSPLCAWVDVDVTCRLGFGVPFFKFVTRLLTNRGATKQQRPHAGLGYSYDKVTESLRRKRNENETKTISINHRRERKRNLASCLIISPVIGRYLSFSFRFRFVFVAEFASLPTTYFSKVAVGRAF